MTDIPSFWRKLRWLLLIFVVFTIVGFLITPPIAQFLLKKNLSQLLHREVLIEDIDFNPFTLSANLSKVLIRDRDSSSTLFSVDEIYADLQISSLINMGLILKEMRIEKPFVNVIRNKDGSYNVSDLLWKDQQIKEEKPSQPLRFSLNNIQIIGGSIDFLDGPKNTKHRARDITITIPMISNFSYFVDTYVHPFFQATINDTVLSLEGKSKPFHDSLETVIDLDIREIDIPYYLAYIPVPLNFKILSGTIDGESKISFMNYGDRPSSILITGDISVHNMKVVDKEGKPLITLPLFSLKKAEVDIAKKELTVYEVYSIDGIISVTRLEDGTVNVQPQLPKLAKKLEARANDKEEKPWKALIKKIIYTDFTVTVEDRMPPDPVHLLAEKVELRARNITTGKNSRGTLSCSFALNKKGTVSAEGSLGINPVSADVSLHLKDIDIIPLQPYITDKLNILMTDGAVSTDGTLSYGTSKEGSVSVNFKGKAALSEFASVDKVHAEDFLKWRSLYLNGIEIMTLPFSLRIDEVALTDFYSKLVITPDGTLNVQGIVKDDKGDGENTVTGKPPGDEPVIDERDAEHKILINAVTLQAGTIDFSDKHITPQYSAKMLEIGGRISGLSSEEESTADVDLRGKLENYAPLEITGRVNPLREDLFVDLAVDFKGIDLSPLTPYSGRYVGYTIQKGKMSMGLKYLIVNKKLDSENKIFLDEFTLGDRIDSPNATKLPVKLAIALLKDRKGEINLDLPVSGNIEDPEFKIGNVVVKLLVNILKKAATSPFALLGALVGGGEELSYIEFEDGVSLINKQAETKLNSLVKALSERPSLNLEIAGYVDREKDMEGLQKYFFQNKLRAQKLKDMVNEGKSAVPFEDIVITPEEYNKYLKNAYEAETFPKPRNASGIVKDLPASEMEKLIFTHLEINDDDLRNLASQRALKVKDFILRSGDFDPQRIFLIESASLDPEQKENVKSSRVDFKLK